MPGSDLSQLPTARQAKQRALCRRHSFQHILVWCIRCPQAPLMSMSTTRRQTATKCAALHPLPPFAVISQAAAPACGESVRCLNISLPSMMLCDYVVVLCVHGISLCLTDGLSVVECSSLARTCVQPMLEHSCGCVIVRCCNRSELQSRGRSTIVATAGVSWSWSHERRWSHL